MVKTSQELAAQAKKLLEKAKQIEEKEFIKVGKLVMQLHKQNKITDNNLIVQINNLLSGKSKNL